MDIDTPVSMALLGQQPQASVANILCCNCGAPIDSSTNNGLAICLECIKLTTDISTGIPREATLHFCRGCERWLQPPHHWLSAQPESRELLALCLRKLKGLSKVRITDAVFIWTEPHSKRLRVKITVQSEAFQNTIVQQAFDVEYIVVYTQCPDCAKSFTAHTWRACVQVRQKVPHKRTFLFLEQLMLKHNAHRDATNIKETKDGLDFFFSQRNHAQKLVDFLTSVAPVRTKKSEELISTDIHTSTKSFKFTFSLELTPICKDDLVCLPPKLAMSIGNISSLVLCSKVANSLHFLDPNSLQTAEIATPVYWRHPFPTLADVQDLVEFIVLDIEPVGPNKGKYILSDVQLSRASDIGRNTTTYLVRTHLGSVLHPGDSVLGYHLSAANYNDSSFEALMARHPEHVPEVILVKKFYPRKKKNKSRNWKLKRLEKESGELAPKKADVDKAERDYELFLREVEEDVELRSALALYKNTKKTGGDRMVGVESGGMEVDGEEEDEEEGLPEINMEELLDEFEELGVDDGDEVVG